MEKIQNQFPYVFTYADDILKNKEASLPSETFSFDQILEHLAQETGLIFSIVDSRFVAIRKNNTKVLVCGFVKDSTGELPLKGVLVVGANTTVTTDKEGYFEVLLGREKEMLVIQSPGYTTKRKPSNTFVNTVCSTIYLELSVEQLSEIIVKDYLIKGINKTTDGNFLLDYTDFNILPGLIEADVLHTVQALPGIQSVDETVSNINIRGGTHDQNLIHWDGVKMYQSGHFFGLISVFDPNITKTVNLIKNGTDPEYTDGVSGTLLMKTDGQINTDISAGLGVDLINMSGFVDIPIAKKSSLQITARKSISDIVKTNTYTQYFDRILQDTEVEKNIDEVSNSALQFGFYDTSLRWLYNVTEKDQIRVNFIAIDNSLKYTENAFVGAINIAKQSSLDQNSIAGGLFYKRNWNEKINTTLQIYETDYQLKANNVNVLDGLNFFQQNKISETNAKFVMDYRFHENFNLHSGYQWTETGVSNISELGASIFREGGAEVIRMHGLFSGLRYESDTKKTAFKIGMRYNYNEKLNFHILEPRWSYYQKFLRYWKLEFSGEFKHQNTSHNINFQNDFLGIENRRWVLSDGEDIPVLRSKQASLGLHYERKGWLISAEGYNKTVAGITAKSQGFLNEYIGENATGAYTVNGIDVLINKNINSFHIWSNYTWSNNNYTFESLDEVNFPNVIDLRHTITLGGSYAMNAFKIATGLNWKSGLPTTRPVAGNEIINDKINFEPAHASRISQYLRLDVSATYDFMLGKGIKVHSGVSVWNFLNRRNILSEYYQLNNDFLSEQVFKTALGITPNAKLRVSF